MVAYAVAERTHEIGIRLALGAARTRVVRMVVRQGMIERDVGIVAGLVGAVAATRLIAGLLYGVERTTLPTFALVTLLLGVDRVDCLRCAGVESGASRSGHRPQTRMTGAHASACVRGPHDLRSILEGPCVELCYSV